MPKTLWFNDIAQVFSREKLEFESLTLVFFFFLIFFMKDSPTLVDILISNKMLVMMT